MKKILLDSNKNYYKANLHCHSTKSDGRMTVEEIKEYYMDRGYSVIAYTDHEHLIDNSYLNDENFLAITSCELDIKEDQNFSTSVNREMKVCHINLLAKDPKNIKTPCYSYFMLKMTLHISPMRVVFMLPFLPEVDARNVSTLKILMV